MRNAVKLATAFAAACGIVGAVSLPATADVPGYSITWVGDDVVGGCSGTGTHWLGFGQFTASDWVQVPPGANSQYHVRVLQDGVTAPVFAGDQPAAVGWETTNLPGTDFVDGKGYSWVAGIDIPGGGIQWTTPCHFRVDHTPPPVPTAVLDDKYVGKPTLPPRRTPRRIKLSVPKGSMVLGFCFIFGVDTTPPVPGDGAICGGTWVPVRPDGTAEITVRPLDPPFDSLSVWTVDHAHDRSDTTVLEVPMAWGGIDKLGDITGDGKIDLLSRLGSVMRYSAGEGNGRLARLLRSQVDIAVPTGLYARVSSTDENGNNGLLAIYNGVMVKLAGDGIGDFGPESCCLSAPDGNDWSNVTQMIGAMDVTGKGNTGVVVVRGGLIQYYAVGPFAVSPGVMLGKADKDTQLIAVQDFNGDGKPDLLVHEGRVLKLYRGNGDGTFKAPVVFAKGLALSHLVDITSDGDANGDHKADLWATTTTGGLVFVPGLGAKGFGKPVPLRTSGWKGVQLY